MTSEEDRRAATILLAGRYLTLATASANRPWATPLAYTIHSDGHLYLYTGIDTRHYRYFTPDWVAAGAVFDSSARNADADGVQFDARVEEVSLADIELVRQTYFSLQFPDPVDRREFEAPASNFLAPARQRFIRLRLTSLFVPDLTAYDVPDDQPKIDRRAPIDVAAVLTVITEQRR